MTKSTKLGHTKNNFIPETAGIQFKIGFENRY